jgi:type IV pilus assembly protein PilA
MKRTEKGFTLIELLVVIAIIGILAAIAIPQFASYRARGFDARARSDLRNGATAQENYFAQNESYLTCADAAACQTDLPGFRASPDVVIEYTSAGQSFTGTSSHPNGTDGVECTWDSATGGDQGCE